MEPTYQPKKNASFIYGLGVAQLVTGIPVMVISLIVILLGFFNFREANGLYYAMQIVMIPVCTGGAILFYSGVKTCRFIENYRKLSEAMQYKNREKVQLLAKSTGQQLSCLVRDLRKLSDKGYFPGASVDLNRCEFVLSGGSIPQPSLNDGDAYLKETVRPSLKPLLAFPYAFLAFYIISPAISTAGWIAAFATGVVICAAAYRKFPRVTAITEKKYKALPPPAPIEIDTGNDALDGLLSSAMDYAGELNELSLSITNESVAGHVKELLDISRQIFLFVEKHPEKVKQIRQFMNYYLPTTIKLLKSYRELSLDKQKSVEIAETLGKIEGSMDVILSTFKRELDNLYRDKAEDISDDVDVMLAMMRQRGLNNIFDKNSQ